MNKFSIGDVVTWTSKAGGHALTKRGSIIEIVPAGSTPKTNLGHHAGGSARVHESYIVAVPRTSKATVRKAPSEMKAKLYWPRVGVLTKVGTGKQFTADDPQRPGAEFAPPPPAAAKPLDSVNELAN